AGNHSTSRTAHNSMTGGSTLLGSGPPRSYGRGEFYGGGAAVPYQAGTRTPKGLAAAPLISGAVLALMPEIWLHSVYPYYYNNSYHLWNRTANATNNNSNDAREYSVCGCDENDDKAYLNDLIGNGSYAALNKSLITVLMVKAKRTIVINGTLPNGTTAPGGTNVAASL
ncbi:hypothetical protein GQ44DRAFT_595915, partial [Phaeosphaeriaceae sp. PMI808]